MDTSILIIDDSENQRRQVHDILRDHAIGSIFHEASDGLKGLKTLVEQEVDLVLCDLEMPGFDGFKFLAAKSDIEERRDIPVIILTGNISAKNKIKGLELGASDYLLKPFDPAELMARVNVHLKIKNLQDELKKSNEKLRELANTDALTGLSSRRVMTSELKKEFQRSLRLKKSLCFLMIDIDFFKKINDTHGHNAGDTVLKIVAKTMREQLRPYDQIARFGGEEFAVILPETDKESAFRVAERLRIKIGELPFKGKMKDHQVTISTGIAVLQGDNYGSEENLINAADKAMYRAKEGGRNRVEVA